MNIGEALISIKQNIPDGVQLIAVSKTQPVDVILEAYMHGQRVFGENKVQELQSKFQLLPKDIQWHMVGHLQSNKVKFIAPFVNLIHSVDSLKLLQVIDEEGLKNNRVIDILLQVKIAEEESKFGLSFQGVTELLGSREPKNLKNIRIIGLMGMATFTDDTNKVQREFRQLKLFFEEVKNKFFNHKDYFKEISMGMSDDYTIAITEGSTMVRIGNKIFGERIYS